MTRLLIARHGNTFDKGDKVVRVGLKTDLSLSQSGQKQAQMLGQFFAAENIKIDTVYCSLLRRTLETANLALKAANINASIHQDPIFNEIDYGVDEGKTEEEVISRIGKQALEAWDKDAVVPQGWSIDPDKIIKDWQTFALKLVQEHPDQTVLVVTSNGIARFAPYLTQDFKGFKQQHDIKLATGSLASFSFEKGRWHSDFWNLKPANNI